MEATGWSIERTSGSAERFHHRPPPAPLRPTVWIHTTDRPALVLGSTQRPGLVDTDAALAAGIEVCQRRSGGGLVFVEPDSSLWIDVVVPRGHELWSDDVGLAFDWLGKAWRQAFADAAPADARLAERSRVHRGRLLHPDWGRVICFAGLGPGELVIDGRKVVGLSQRRTRDAARFQGLAVSSLGAPTLRQFVRPGALPPDLDAELDTLPVGMPFDLDRVCDSFIRALPASSPMGSGPNN